MVLAEWSVGQVLWSMIWFFLFFIWIWILITVFIDIFRSHDLGGLAKALWVIFVIIFPFLGVFIYLIVRGGGMAKRRMEEAQAANAQFQDYVRSVAPAGSGGSVADELQRLATLRDQGVITQEEFDSLKAKAMA